MPERILSILIILQFFTLYCSHASERKSSVLSLSSEASDNVLDFQNLMDLMHQCELRREQKKQGSIKTSRKESSSRISNIQETKQSESSEKKVMQQKLSIATIKESVSSSQNGTEQRNDRSDSIQTINIFAPTKDRNTDDLPPKYPTIKDEKDPIITSDCHVIITKPKQDRQRKCCFW